MISNKKITKFSHREFEQTACLMKPFSVDLICKGFHTLPQRNHSEQEIEMKKFMDRDFLLKSDYAKHLFHDYAEKMPIVDYHCHISPKEIYEDRLITLLRYG